MYSFSEISSRANIQYGFLSMIMAKSNLKYSEPFIACCQYLWMYSCQAEFIINVQLCFRLTWLTNHYNDKTSCFNVKSHCHKSSFTFSHIIINKQIPLWPYLFLWYSLSAWDKKRKGNQSVWRKVSSISQTFYQFIHFCMDCITLSFI